MLATPGGGDRVRQAREVGIGEVVVEVGRELQLCAKVVENAAHVLDQERRTSHEYEHDRDRQHREQARGAGLAHAVQRIREHHADQDEDTAHELAPSAAVAAGWSSAMRPSSRRSMRLP